MIEMYLEMNVRGLDLWNDFLSAFWSNTIDSWLPGEAGRWNIFLRERGIHVDSALSFPRSEVLKRVL